MGLSISPLFHRSISMAGLPMTSFRPQSYLDIARGKFSALVGVNKFGRNANIDTAADEDIWDGGGTWVAPTAARTHDIASTSANDTSAGTGARTVRIYGLQTWATAESTEDVTLNGTSNVATANSYVIIYRMQVLTVGSGGTNAGDITATAQTDATVTAQISIGEGQTLMAIYGIPSGTIAYGTKWYAAINRTLTSGSIDCSLLVKTNADQSDSVFRVDHRLGLSLSGTSYVEHGFLPPVPVVGPAIVKVRGIAASANNTDVSAGFDFVLETV